MLEQVSGVMVGFVPNLRRPLFQDARVRRAFNLAFNFEDLNRTIFFGQYERINSFYFGLPIGASGIPEGKELEDLNAVKNSVPPEVFTTPYTNPDNGDPSKARKNLQQAIALMKEAGYELKGNRMVDKNGRQVTVELLNGAIERPQRPNAPRCDPHHRKTNTLDPCLDR